MHRLYYRIPSEIRAESPDEVGTVVRIECADKAVARYTDGGTGYRADCDVTLIDKSQDSIIVRKKFTGEQPPPTKSGGGTDWHGSKPTGKIAEYLTGLPRR